MILTFLLEHKILFFLVLTKDSILDNGDTDLSLKKVVLYGLSIYARVFLVSTASENREKN